jgi:signal transduction histidine kinase
MHRLSEKIGIDGIDLEKVFNFLPYPFLVSEQRGDLRYNIFVNKKFVEELGYSCADIPTIDDWFVKAYPDSVYRQEIQAKWTTLEAEATDEHGDFALATAKIHTKSLGDKWYEVKASMYGTIRFVTFVNIDEEINRKIELQRLNENKNLTLSILSHDLRSPLQNLYAILQLTMSGHISESERQESLQKLSNDVFQMMEFLDTTLHWTRTNFDVAVANRETLDMQVITQDVLTFYNSACQQKQISVELKLDRNYVVLGDAGIWSILIRNVISNAIKFTPPSGTISIYNPPMNGKYILAIENSGTAITGDKIRKILNRNYTSENGTEGEKGLGLGLKLCQQLLHNIGGHLDIESPDSKTTVVKIVC